MYSPVVISTLRFRTLHVSTRTQSFDEPPGGGNLSFAPVSSAVGLCAFINGGTRELVALLDSLANEENQ